MPVTDKTVNSFQTTNSPGMVPDIPNVVPTLLDVPGMQEQNALWQEWWNGVRRRLFDDSQKVGINLHNGKVSVVEEATARETADGFLEGKYTLTVQAGDVVTGMEITSSTGPNAGTVSQVSFRADKFQIYSGASNKEMFVADAGQDKVRIAGVLTVDRAGSSVYVKTTAGAGAYNSAGTPWYVDDAGKMSLSNKLTWDGATLTITGSVTATSGTIGGWTIGASTLTGGNASLSSAGQLILGTANDIVYVSATDATYRLWVGNATSGSATFRVTKGGVLTATGATISGSVTASSGTIGGWSIGASTLSANNATLDSAGQLILGTANNIVYLSSTDATYRLWIGNAAAGSAAFAVTKTGILGAQGAIISGAITATSGAIGGFTISGSQLVGTSAGDTVTLSPGSAGYLGFTEGATSRTTFFAIEGVTVLNASGNLVVELREDSGGGGYGHLVLASSAGTQKIIARGDTGDISATTFTGDGSAITALNASNIASGTLVDARLPSVLTRSNGTAGAPTYSYGSDTDTGWYWSASGTMNASTNGTARLTVRDAAIVCLVPVKLDNNYVAGAPTATGYVTMQDATGTTYKFLVGT